jgi:hypothetical protein
MTTRRRGGTRASAGCGRPTGAASGARGCRRCAVRPYADCCWSRHHRTSISNATVHSYLSFHGATLDAAGAEEALACRGTTAAQLSLQFAESPKGHVALSRTKVMLIRDSPANWPASLRVDGTVYDILRPALPAEERLPWLTRDPEGFTPQPYEQLATVYQSHGRDADARTVLVAKQRSLRPTLRVPRPAVEPAAGRDGRLRIPPAAGRMAAGMPAGRRLRTFRDLAPRARGRRPLSALPAGHLHPRSPAAAGRSRPGTGIRAVRGHAVGGDRPHRHRLAAGHHRRGRRRSSPTEKLTRWSPHFHDECGDSQSRRCTAPFPTSHETRVVGPTDS